MAEFDSLVDAEAAPRGTLVQAPAAITQEDRDLDEMLERAAKQNNVPDLGQDKPLVIEKKKRDTLRNVATDYRPASTPAELEEQIFQAKQHEIDSIEATPKLVQYLWKKDFEHIRTQTGYGIYKDIRVYIDGFFEQNKDADKLTMEQRLHGRGSKIDIAPIITPQKI